jgi:hypothetical protein
MSGMARVEAVQNILCLLGVPQEAGLQDGLAGEHTRQAWGREAEARGHDPHFAGVGAYAEVDDETYGALLAAALKLAAKVKRERPQRIRKILERLESCCLDDEEDFERVLRALVENIL